MKAATKSVLFMPLLCLMITTACRNEQPPKETAPYQTITLQKESRRFNTTYSATIRGRQDIEIYPQVEGTLWQLYVTEGQRIRKGQLLFVIDPVPYRAAFNTASANMKAAEAALATAQLSYQSKNRLYEEEVISDFELQKAANELLSAQAAVEQARAQQENAANSLSYTEIKSPSDGLIGTLPYRQGALVSSNIPQPLTVVSDNSAMYVYFSMNETQLLTLTRQYGSPEKAIAGMPGIQLTLSDGSTYEEEGKIESISGIIEQATGSVSLRAVFPNTNNILHSGSTGNIILPVQYDDCIVIPQAATFMLQDKILVYKVIDGKAQSTAITLSSVNNGTEYVVTDGLAPGDEIIATGAGLVREGTIIRQNP